MIAEGSNARNDTNLKRLEKPKPKPITPGSGRKKKSGSRNANKSVKNPSQTVILDYYRSLAGSEKGSDA